jgi:hypothetical protein
MSLVDQLDSKAAAHHGGTMPVFASYIHILLSMAESSDGLVYSSPAKWAVC